MSIFIFTHCNSTNIAKKFINIGMIVHALTILSIIVSAGKSAYIHTKHIITKQCTNIISFYFIIHANSQATPTHIIYFN